MKTTLLVTAALMFASAAHAERLQANCWAWVMKDGNLICELQGPSDSTGQANAIYRDAQRLNNEGRTYQSTTVSVDGDGKTIGTTTTTTTFPRYR